MTERILAAHQPQYLPYPGVIHKIAVADVFVVQDDLQFARQEWQNRNRIRTHAGHRWLTIPVHSGHTDRINQVMPADKAWLATHRRIVALEYRTSRFLRRADHIWEQVAAVRERNLAEIGLASVKGIRELLGITTPMILESEIGLPEEATSDRDSRLQALCHRLGCSTYLSGSGARAYLDERRWHDSGIKLAWQQYTPTRYEQLYPGWVENLSVLDMLLCVEHPGKLVNSR